MGFENFWTPKQESDRRLQEELGDFSDVVRQSNGSEPKEGQNSNEKVPAGLISTTEIFEKQGVTLDEVYGWYAAAISRRDRKPLESGRFVGHFEGMSADLTFAFGEREKGYVLGYVKYGVFVPTHFAPKTMRSGYELMKQLGDSTNVPAIMSVTEDLKDTLSKMPSWHEVDMSFLASFRDTLTEKKIVYNSHPDTRNLMLGLISEYLEETKDHDSENDK